MKQITLTIEWDDDELTWTIQNPEPMSGKDTLWIIQTALGDMVDTWDKDEEVEL